MNLNRHKLNGWKALSWVSEQHPETLSREKVQDRSRSEIMCELIYELTGKLRTRRQVTHHYHELKRLHSARDSDCEEDIAPQISDNPDDDDQDGTPDLHQVVQNTIMDWLLPVESKHSAKAARFGILPSPRKSAILSDNPDIVRYLSTIASNRKDGLSVRCNTDFAQNLLSLSLVNHFYRTESLDAVAWNDLRFDFGSDGQALRLFCSTAPIAALAAVRHLHVTLVEGYMPDLPALPNLCTFATDLWPRNPTRREWDDRAWGKQTETLLAALGVVLAVGARITLEMRWAADCERFEREYVGEGRWSRVIEADENGAPDRRGPFHRRCYELRGKGMTVAEVTGKEKAVVSGSDELVLSFGSLALLPKGD